MKEVTQVTLKCEEPDKLGHHRQMTTWLDADKRIVVGANISLKDMDDVRWVITHVYGTQDKHTVDSNRGWDNNNYDKHDGRAMKDRVK